jgi:VanZ family protein
VQRRTDEVPLWLPRTARLLLLLGLLVAAAFTLGTRRTAEIDLFAALLRDAVATFTPFALDQLSVSRVEFVANILLFLPLGLLLPPAFPRAPLTLLLLLPAGLSLGVEVAQKLVLVGRTPDAADVLSNATGGAVGILLGADLVRLVCALAAERRSGPPG